MIIDCYSISYRTATVAVRECLSIAPVKLGTVAKQLQELFAASGCVVIATCNRSEFYFSWSDEQTRPDFALVMQRLQQHFNIEEPLESYFTPYADREAQLHLCRVAAGLESMVLGETEIFGQVKDAYAHCLKDKACDAALNRFFQQSFKIGKKIRTHTAINQGNCSVASVAVDLATREFGELHDSKVLVLGAGEMSRLTAQALKSRGATSIFVANRTYETACSLAQEMGGLAVRFDNWTQYLTEVDIVISSTASPNYVVRPEHIQSMRQQRKYRSLLLIDIAVPRDIDPECQQIEEVYLYDIDTLQGYVDAAKNKRSQEILRCEEIILQEVARNDGWKSAFA